MAAIIRFRWVGRATILILFLVAVYGPWTITHDGVPPPEWCAAPNFLDEHGQCAGLVQGVEILRMWGWLTPGNLATIASPIELAQIALMLAVLVLLVLPFFSTLALFLDETYTPLHRFRLVVCVLAGGLWLYLTFWQMQGSLRYWGVWLYIALCLAGAGCETYYWKKTEIRGVQVTQPG